MGLETLEEPMKLKVDLVLILDGILGNGAIDAVKCADLKKLCYERLHTQRYPVLSIELIGHDSISIKEFIACLDVESLRQQEVKFK